MAATCPAAIEVRDAGRTAPGSLGRSRAPHTFIFGNAALLPKRPAGATAVIHSTPEPTAVAPIRRLHRQSRALPTMGPAGAACRCRASRARRGICLRAASRVCEQDSPRRVPRQTQPATHAALPAENPKKIAQSCKKHLTLSDVLMAALHGPFRRLRFSREQFAPAGSTARCYARPDASPTPVRDLTNHDNFNPLVYLRHD